VTGLKRVRFSKYHAFLIFEWHCIHQPVDGDVNDQPDMQMALHFADGSTLTRKELSSSFVHLIACWPRLEMGLP